MLFIEKLLYYISIFLSTYIGIEVIFYPETFEIIYFQFWTILLFINLIIFSVEHLLESAQNNKV